MSNVQDMPVVEEVKSSLAQGATALQTRSSFQTAMKVVQERNLREVQRKCIEEAAIAAGDFYYSWKQGGENIEGLSVGAALAMVRNFGNCAVEVQVQETATSYVFNGVFIDLETGFNLVRPFRQSKSSPKKKDGTDIYKGDRGSDIIFQIGASKAIRNVVLNAVPRWLSTQVIEKAKENVVGKIEQMGAEKAKSLVKRKAEALGISFERVENQYGKERAWKTEDIVQISSALRAIEDGNEKALDLFPMVGEQEHKEPEVTSAKVVQKEEPKPEPVKAPEGTKIPLTKDELLAKISEVPTVADLNKFKGQYLVDIDALKPLEHEEVVNAIVRREIELKPAEPKSEASVVIEWKNKITKSHMKLTLNKFSEEIKKSLNLDGDQIAYLLGLVEEQLKTAK